MKDVRIELNFPGELLLSLNHSKEELQKELVLTFATDLYKKGKISLGKAAELAGYTKLGFLEILKYKGETVFNYTDEEIEEELRNIDRELRDNN